MHDAEQLQAKLDAIEARYEADVARDELWGVGALRLVLLPTIFLMVALSVIARGEPLDAAPVLYAFGLAVLLSAGFQVATWLVMKCVLAYRTHRRATARLSSSGGAGDEDRERRACALARRV
jgi:hypothetical protein